MSLIFKNRPKKAMSFNGSDQYILLQEVSDFRPDRLDAFSLVAWIRITNNFSTIFSNQDDFLGAGLGGQGLQVSILNGQLQLAFLGTTQGLVVGSNDFTSLDDGLFHHIVVTKASGSSASGSVSLYVDGEESTLQVIEDDLTSESTVSSGIINIGSRNATAGFLNGYLRNVQFYDYELTSPDVVLLYNNNRMIDIRGLNLSSGLPIGYWTLEDGPLHQSLNDGVDVDGSSLDGTLVNYTTNGLRFAAKSEIYRDVSFNGITQYGSMPHNASLTFTAAQAYTVIAWVEYDGTNGGYVVSKFNATPRGWGVTIEDNESMQHIQIDDGGSGSRQGSTAASVWPIDRKPHLGIWSYNGSSSAAGYVFQRDLVTYATSVTSNLTCNTYGGAADITFSARSGGAGAISKTNQYWTAVYSGLLSDNEKEEIYIAGPFSPPPQNNKLLTCFFNNGDGTIPSFPSTVTLNNSAKHNIKKYNPPISAGKLGTDYSPLVLFTLDTVLTDTSGNAKETLTLDAGSQSYVGYASGAHGHYLNGTNILGQQITDASLQITGNLTVQCTFYCRSLPNQSILVRMGGANTDVSNTNILYQISIQTNGALTYLAEHSAGTDVSYQTSSGLIVTGKLYHIVMVRSSSVVSFYLNGRLVGQSGTLTDPTDGSTALLKIGGFVGLTQTSNGIISNVKIHNSALTETQIITETDRVLGRVNI